VPAAAVKGEAMELIERYIREVERRLPKGLRNDVTKELRSLLQDAVDARSAAEGRDAGDEVIEDVLREFGPPASMARSYLPSSQFLIGPRFYRSYILTLKVSISVIAAIVLLGVIFFLHRASLTHAQFLTVLLRTIGRFPLTAMTTLGIITFVYALIERYATEETGQTEQVEEAWNPADLPPLEDPDRINRVSFILGTCIYVIFFLWFNFFPEYVGIFYHTSKTGWGFLPLLSDEFKPHLYRLDIFWALSCIFNYALLRAGRWQRWSRLCDFSLSLFAIYITYLMLTGPPILELDPYWLAARDVSQSVREALEGVLLPVLMMIVRIAMAGCIVIFALDALQHLKKILRRRPA
jgi:hypothetical protein